jgi:bisphosphoglycerate-independent phosphoglycerate mutase (AlkP superfamily)
VSLAVSLGVKQLAYKDLPEEGPGEWCYLDATPASCVKFGLQYKYENRNQDLVVAGINHGSNCSTGANYSATLGCVEEAAIKAIETIDKCVGRVVEAVVEVGGQMFITADHGNAEQLVDYETGEPLTAHTTNPVPFILVNYDPAYTLREGGALCDIIPTLIEMMGMEQPKEMTGKSLLVRR